MKRPIISLGDALRACSELHPADEEARQTLRELLGAETGADNRAPVSLGAWMPSSSHDVMAHQRKAKLKEEGLPKEVSKAETIPDPNDSIDSFSKDRAGGISELSLLQKRGELPSAPEWLNNVAPLEVGKETTVAPAVPPLFDRIRQRSILSATLATHVAEGELDFQRIIEIVSKGRPLTLLPRLFLPTLRRGVQVLLDVGQGMDPFADDQRGLVRALDDVLADDRLEILRFKGCPSRGVSTEADSVTRPWRSPASGVPVVVLTDLGIGGPMLDQDRATTAEWLDFANKVREEGHVLVGFVPYEATRWPQRLIRAMTLIHWSERTTVGAVRRAVRDSRGRTVQ